MKCMKGFMRDSKAAIGIGTLIVFIALILVASIAAAVIIETADKLSNQAERTGSDAAASATGGIAVVNTVGRVGPDGGGGRQINELYLTIVLNAGSTGIDMRDLIVTYQDPTDYEANTTWVRSTLHDVDGINYILGRGETMNLTIQNVAIAPGEEFIIKLIPPNRVPGTLESYIASNDLSNRFLILI